MVSRVRARREFLVAGARAAGVATLAAGPLAGFAQQRRNMATDQGEFRRIRTQFIAALAAPDARSGRNADEWGLWRLDPGPRGVTLGAFEHMKRAGGQPLAGWELDESDWWLEEHGLIMEAPEFPLAAGRYLVTGDRSAVSVLSVAVPDADGRQHWELSDGANIYDVTHLRCRSARYTPAGPQSECSPLLARQSDFPVSPGAPMPPVEQCAKQDYAVLLVIGVPTNS